MKRLYILLLLLLVTVSLSAYSIIIEDDAFYLVTESGEYYIDESVYIKNYGEYKVSQSEEDIWTIYSRTEPPVMIALTDEVREITAALAFDNAVLLLAPELYISSSNLPSGKNLSTIYCLGADDLATSRLQQKGYILRKISKTDSYFTIENGSISSNRNSSTPTSSIYCPYCGKRIDIDLYPRVSR